MRRGVKKKNVRNAKGKAAKVQPAKEVKDAKDEPHRETPPTEVIPVPLSDLRAHPDRDLLPELSPGERNALEEDIKARGIVVPLCVTEQNIVLCGNERWIAAWRVGLETVPAIRRAGLSKEDQLLHILSDNLQRRHLEKSQRAAIWTSPRVRAIWNAFEVDAWTRKVDKRSGQLPQELGEDRHQRETVWKVGDLAQVSGELIRQARCCWEKVPETMHRIAEGKEGVSISALYKQACPYRVGKSSKVKNPFKMVKGVLKVNWPKKFIPYKPGRNLHVCPKCHYEWIGECVPERWAEVDTTDLPWKEAETSAVPEAAVAGANKTLDPYSGST